MRRGDRSPLRASLPRGLPLDLQGQRPAIAFYERHGWRPDGAEKVHARRRWRSGSDTRRPDQTWSQCPVHERDLRREAGADPALRAGHLARRRQGARRDRRRDQARLQRVALPAASRGGGRHRPGGRRDQSISATRTLAHSGARSPTTTRPTRPGSPSPMAPARSCSPRRWRCARRATRSSSPGPRSRSIRTWRRSAGRGRSGYRSARDYVHDLDAMLEEVTAATQLLIVCNPNNPTGTHSGRADRRLRRERPRPRPRSSSTRPTSSIRPTTIRTPRSTCWRSTRTWSCCAPSASLTGSRGCGSAMRSAHRNSAPRSTPSASPSASTRSRRPRRRRRSAIRMTSPAASRRTSSSASSWRTPCTSWASRPPSRQTNFAWIDLGDLDEGEVVESLAKAGVAVRPGTPLGGPGSCASPMGPASRTSASSRRCARSPAWCNPSTSPIEREPLVQSQHRCSTARTPLLPRAASRFLRARISTSGDLPRRPARGCH